MKVLMTCGDLWKNQIAHKFTCFGVDGVNVFQGSKSGVSKQICNNYVSRFIKVHYIAHHTNLIVPTLLKFLIMNRLENLLQKLHSFLPFT